MHKLNYKDGRLEFFFSFGINKKVIPLIAKEKSLLKCYSNVEIIFFEHFQDLLSMIKSLQVDFKKWEKIYIIKYKTCRTHR